MSLETKLHFELLKLYKKCCLTGITPRNQCKKKHLTSIEITNATHPTSATDWDVEEAFCSRNSQAVMTTGSANNTWRRWWRTYGH